MMEFVFESQLSSLLEVAARATIIFCFAMALAWLVRKRSAKVRHRLWTLTLALLLALPFLFLVGPSWDVPLLPSPGRAGGLSAVEAPAGAGRVELAATTGVPGEPDDVGRAVPGIPEATPARRSVSLPLFIWTIGWVAVLASVCLGILRFRELVRSAEAVDDPEWRSLLKSARNELGLQTRVRLLLGGEVSTPMTGGLWRSVILLPASAASWSAARRGVVLTHELVHVGRRDALRQLLGRLVLALYWFHPLAWVALRLAAASREEACDEEVLAVGVRPSEYAGHLLAMAENVGQGRASPALPIVDASRLEARIKAIVRSDGPRRSGPFTAVITTAVCVAGIFASCADPVPVRVISAGDSAQIVEHFGGMDCPVVSAGATEGRWRWSSTMAVPPSGSLAGWFRPRMALACMAVGGDVVMSRDVLEVRAIGPGGAVVLESVGARTHVLEITQGPDGLEYDWTIDGRKQAFDEEARQWRDLMLAVHRGKGALGFDGTWGPGGGPHGRLHVHQAVAGMRGQEASLRRKVALLLGQLAEYRAEELSFGSALKAASNRRVRALLEDEIADRTERIRVLEERIEALELSAIEAEIHYMIGSYDSETDARDLAEALEDPVAYLSAPHSESTRQIEALRRLIDG